MGTNRRGKVAICTETCHRVRELFGTIFRRHNVINYKILLAYEVVHAAAAYLNFCSLSKSKHIPRLLLQFIHVNVKGLMPHIFILRVFMSGTERNTQALHFPNGTVRCYKLG